MPQRKINIYCQNWINPITPAVVSGFQIKTYDRFGNILDLSKILEIDARSLEPAEIKDSDIMVSLSDPALG